jgi:hypothetical protein
MMMNRLLAGLLSSAAILAAADLPTAEVVFSKYVDATGGISSFEKINSMSLQGTIEIVGQGLTGPITIVNARPDKMDTTLDLAGVGKFRSGANEGVAWDFNPMQGPRVLDGAERDQMLRQARMDKFVNWKANYTDVKVDAEETIDGKACWRLLATPAKSTKVEKLWFDKESGLLVKVASTIATPQGELPAETSFSDYRDVSGNKVAFKMAQNVGPQAIMITLETVKINPDLPPTQFDPPAEVRALMTKK